MMKTALALAVLLATVPAPVVAAAPQDPPSVEDRVDLVVTVGSVADLDGAVASARAAGGEITRVYRDAVAGFAVTMPVGVTSSLSFDEAVVSVEVDGAVTATSDVRAEVTQTDATWGLDRIDQRSLPLDGNYDYDESGAGVVVYIVDSGVRSTHDEFAGRVAGGYTAIGGGTDDCSGHGTHVAGTVAGRTWGVAKSATIVPVRVLACDGAGTTSDLIDGLDWIVANHAAGTPGVVNLSLGLDFVSAAVNAAVQQVIDAGMPVVAAAGNSGGDACGHSPSNVAAAVTVGATTTVDARSPFSDVGSCLDVFAPGSGITSADVLGDFAARSRSGTSMATSHVTGVIAIELERSPGSTPEQIARTITSNATKGKVGGAGAGSPNRLLYGGGDTPAASVSVSASSAGSKRVGSVSNVWGRVSASPGGRVFTQVRVAGVWRTSQVRSSDATGFYVIPLTYGASVPGVYTWRVGAVTSSGMVFSDPFEFVRTAT